MPRIDPKLAVIMSVAIILSTLVVLTIFRVDQPEDITVLRNRAPEVFVKESAQKGIETVFSFGALSGREMEEMVLKFSILYQEPPPYDDGDWQPGEDTGLEELVSHIPIITMLETKAMALGGDVEVIERDLEINGTVYSSIFYDFSGFLGIFNEEEDLSRWTTLFAVLKSEDSVRFFKGRTGFFLSQDEVVKYLMVSYNDNKSEYLGSEIPDAPFGILRYSHLSKDDKVTLIFEVLSQVDQLPEIPLGAKDRLILQLIKGYADGELSVFLVNGVPMG